MHKRYIIVSLKYSSKKRVCFWREGANGYTENPFMAGVYSEEEVIKDKSYYNNGNDTIAVEITQESLEAAGLFVPMNLKKVMDYFKTYGKNNTAKDN